MVVPKALTPLHGVDELRAGVVQVPSRQAKVCQVVETPAERPCVVGARSLAQLSEDLDSLSDVSSKLPERDQRTRDPQSEFGVAVIEAERHRTT